MKWLLVNSSSHREIYELWNSQEKILTIDYHPDKGSLRTHARDEKRAFLIGRAGFLRSRIVLRNEYGIRIAQINDDSADGNQGSVEVDDQQFNYLIQDTSPRKAAIFRNSELLVTCELPATIEHKDLLILTLCWYIASTVKTKVEEYA